MRVDGSNPSALVCFVLPPTARVRGGNNGEICPKRPREVGRVRPVGKAVNPQDTRITPGICQQPAQKPEGVVMFTYKCKRWRDLAARAMRRDGYMCQLSKRYGKQVPAELVHHIYPVDEYPEYGYCLWNLISLSRAMHNTLHDRNTDKLTAEGVALMRRTKPSPG